MKENKKDHNPKLLIVKVVPCNARYDLELSSTVDCGFEVGN